ncbi:hypothetical protein [Myxococcus phage Mx1]|nr:hypothetical protein [Myxococcus phage Mx1]
MNFWQFLDRNLWKIALAIAVIGITCGECNRALTADQNCLKVPPSQTQEL